MNHKFKELFEKAKGLGGPLQSLDKDTVVEQIMGVSNPSDEEAKKIRAFVGSGQIEAFMKSNPSLDNIMPFIKSVENAK